MTTRYAARAALAILALPGLLFGQSRSDTQPGEGEPPPAVPLVDVDRTTEDRLAEIARWVQEKRYDEAQEALHGLMTAQDGPALRPVPSDARRYETTIEAAARALAAMPDEAQDLYCRRHDLAAGKLFEAARQRRDEAGLLSVGRRYFHTPHGGRAMALAAEWAFDRGAYLEAAAVWQRLYREHRRLGGDPAALLTRAAVAWHMGGLPDRAAALLAELKEHHAVASATIAGKPTTLVAFLSEALAQQPALSPAPPEPTADWTSLAGSPRSVSLMAGCEAAAIPVWSDGEASRNASLRDSLGIASAAEAQPPEPPMSVAIEGGRVRVRRAVPGWADLRFDLPPLIHPLVVAGAVLCRREAAVVATSLADGRELWRTRDLPVRAAAGGEPGDSYRRAVAGDMGRCALTAGDGRVYTVCRFGAAARPGFAPRAAERAGEADGSSLVGLSLGGDGAPAVAWEVGNGHGEQEALRQAKYLSAPTLADGRLYVIARRANRYSAMCLDAAKGTLVWEAPLGVVPMRGGAAMSWQQVHALEVVTERGSPPAVADGTVFFTTNAGIVAAFDAATGCPLWAHRYDSRVSGPADAPSAADLQGQAIRVATLRRPCPPVNPLVVAEGRVICLPCDSDRVLAFHAGSGELLWRHDRQGQQDLTALDDGAVLLSGPELVVLSVRDGSQRRRWAGQVLGRPAVAAGRIVASGDGALIDVDVARGTVRRTPLMGDDAMLGRLVMAGGRLVAVNAAGASAYADYDTARAMVQAQAAAAAQPARRAALVLRAGMLALASDRLDEAVTQLTAARDAAGRAGESVLAAQAGELLFDAHMRQYRRAADKASDAARHLDAAARCAAAPAQREQVLLERVRHAEKLGRTDEAVRLAQDIVAEQADRWRTGRTPSLTEYFLARRELRRLVVKGGAAAYAPFEAKMSAALDRAAAREPNADELLALCRQWPLARRSGEALLLAADRLFRRATASQPADLKLAMKAARALGQARCDPCQETRTTAMADQLVMDLRLRPNLAPVLAAELEGAKPTTPVRFGGFAGTVGELLARAAATRQRPMPPEDPLLAGVSLPLHLAFEADIGPVAVLRDTHGLPVRLGERIFLCGRGGLTCFDAQRGDANAGRLWTVELPPQVVPGERVGQRSSDGRLLAVLDRNNLLVVDAVTGKEEHRLRLDWLGARGWTTAAGDRDWLALCDEGGTLSGLDIREGRRIWKLHPARWGVSGMSVQSEVLLVESRGGGALCCDIRTGRVLSWLSAPQPRRIVRAMLTDEAQAVTLEDSGTLRIRDIRMAPGGEGRTAEWGSAQWHPLASASRFAAFRSTAGGGKVRVLDLLEPARDIELRAGDEPNRLPQPVRLAFVAGRALLLYADEIRPHELVAPGVAGFELPSGRLLWSRPLAAASAGPCRVSAPCPCGEFVGLTVLSDSSAVRPRVIRVADGAMFDCSTARTDAARAWPGAGSPVVLNGWVVVPHQSGLACLVGDKP